MNDLTPFIETLQSRIRISSVIGEDVKLIRKNHNQYMGVCPFHKERTGSFSVNDDKNLYHCFGCGASGNVFNYLEKKRSLTFMAALEMLANQQGMSIPKRTEQKEDQKQDKSYEVLADATLWMEENLAKSTGEKAREYLDSRRIDKKIQKDFHLGYTLDSPNALMRSLSTKYSIDDLVRVGLVIPGKNIDRFKGRVMFPICDRQGRVVAFGGRVLDETQPKYLNSSDTPLFSKGHILYGQHLAAKNLSSDKGYIVTEGYLDVISLHANGFQTAVAPLGTALTEYHLQLLWRHKVPPILCFDGDTAGYNAAIRSAKRALPFLTPEKRLNFVFLPQGEDPDSLVKKDKNLFTSLIAKPTPLSEVLWKNLLEETPLKTPEDHALLKQKIQSLTEQITHTDMRQSYIRYFNDCLFASRKTKEPKKITKALLPSLKGKNTFVLQKIILATLIHHPHLISQALDSLMSIVMEDSLNGIREFLMCYKGELLKESVMQSAKEQGINFDVVLDLETFNKAPFIKQSDVELVFSGWKEIYNRLEYMLNLEKEVKNAGQLLKQGFEEKNWNRIKELQSLKLRSQIENG